MPEIPEYVRLREWGGGRARRARLLGRIAGLAPWIATSLRSGCICRRFGGGLLAGGAGIELAILLCNPRQDGEVTSSSRSLMKSRHARRLLSNRGVYQGCHHGCNRCDGSEPASMKNHSL